jgi:uncharacterized protein (TIGR02145 family)
MKKALLFAAVQLLVQFGFSQTFTCGDTLIDVRDGQTYTTVLIGSDCWFSQNLNYGTYVQSDSLGVIHSQQTNNGIAEKYAQYNDTNNLPIYGGLYEQAELMAFSSSPQGLCPSGWHVSTDAEWQALIAVAGGLMTSATGGHGGNALKQIGEGFGGGAGTDAVGFAAKHGGDRDGFGVFYGLGYRAIFWTSTPSGPNQAYHYTLWADNDTIERLSLGVVTTGFSCRCVKNSTNSIGDDQQENSFKIFPNPASDNFSIENLQGESRITVRNILGETIFSQESVTENRLTITVSDWPAGCYFVDVTNAETGSVSVEKLIVE